MSYLRPFLAGVVLDSGEYEVQQEVEWRVEREFGAPRDGDTQAVTDAGQLAASSWQRMLTTYRCDPGTGNLLWFRCPDRGRLSIRRHRGEYVLVFEPMTDVMWAFAAGGWRAPHGTCLVLRTPALADEVRRNDITRWVLYYAIRGGDAARFLREEEGRLELLTLLAEGGVREILEVLARDGVFAALDELERQARAAESRILDDWIGGRDLPLWLPRDALIDIGVAGEDFRVDAGWAVIPRSPPESPGEEGDRDYDGAWTWLDVNEVLRRIDEGGAVQPPFRWPRRPDEDTADPPRLRAWHELETLSPARVRRVRAGDIDLHNPPPSSEPVSEEVLRVRPGAPVDIFAASAATEWWREERTADGRRALAADELLEDNPRQVGAGPSATATIAYTSYAARAGDGTHRDGIEPTRIRVMARAAGDEHVVTLWSYPSVIAAASAAADDVMQAVGRHGQLLQAHHPATPYIGPGHAHAPIWNAQALTLAKRQQTILGALGQRASEGDHQAGRLRADLEERLRSGGSVTSDRRNSLLAAEARISHVVAEAARRLNDLYTARLFEEIVSAPSERVVAELDRISEAMLASDLGRAAMHERLSGFIDDRDMPGTPSADSPAFSWIHFKLLWGASAAYRSHLARAFIKLAQTDFHVRTMNQAFAATGPIDGNRYRQIFDGFASQIEDKLGDLEGVEVRRRSVRVNVGFDVELSMPWFHLESDAVELARMRPQPGAILTGLNGALAMVFAGLAADDFARNPTPLKFANLAGSVRDLLDSTLTLAEASVQARAGALGRLNFLQGASGAAGVLLAGLTLHASYERYMRAEATGDDDQIFWNGVALTTAVLSAAQQGLALAGVSAVSAGPVGVAVGIVLGVTSVVAFTALAVTADSPLELDFAHTLFGDDYPDIGQIAATPPLSRIDTTNARGDFFGDLGVQIAQMTGYLVPVRAAFRREPETPLAPPSLLLELQPTGMNLGSLVVIQLWRLGEPPAARRTFSFLITEDSRPPPAPMLGRIRIQVNPNASRWEVSVRFLDGNLPALADVDLAAVTVTVHEPPEQVAERLSAIDGAADPELAHFEVLREFLDRGYPHAARVIVPLQT